jgi:hypothetical protein
MENDQEDTKLAPWEAALLRHTRQMDQRARSEMLQLAAAMADTHPLRPSRPSLRLVKTDS